MPRRLTLTLGLAVALSAAGLTLAQAQSRPPAGPSGQGGGYNPGAGQGSGYNPGGGTGGSGYNPGGSGGSGYNPGGGSGYNPGHGGGYNPGYPSRPDHGGRPPRHAYITLYEHARYRGASRTLEGPQPNLLRYGFTNKASSFHAEGRWELCDLTNFRGRCIVRSGDVRDLAPTGLNDRVSSLRPIR